MTEEPEAQEPAVPPVPPPSLETSDEELRQRLGEATDSPLVATAAGKDHLVERLADSIDSLSRGLLAYKALPLPAPQGKFAVMPSGGKVLLDPANYRRYDAYAQMIEDINASLTSMQVQHAVNRLRNYTDGVGKLARAD